MNEVMEGNWIRKKLILVEFKSNEIFSPEKNEKVFPGKFPFIHFFDWKI